MIEAIFNPLGHTYTSEDGGVRFPSVTQICSLLSDWQFVDDGAAQFGSHVHQAISMHLAGTLDYDALDENLKSYLQGAIRFLDDSGLKITAFEEVVLHERLRYAGRLDLRGVTSRRTRRKQEQVIVDWKTGVLTKTVGPQLSGYANAVDEPRSLRWCVLLEPFGYRVIECDDARDWPIFTSALTVWRFKNG